jgi:hypothetical protein
MLVISIAKLYFPFPFLFLFHFSNQITTLSQLVQSVIVDAHLFIVVMLQKSSKSRPFIRAYKKRIPKMELEGRQEKIGTSPASRKVLHAGTPRAAHQV